jgi:hypothetical protein
VHTALEGHTTLDQAVERTVRRFELDKREASELRHDVRRVARELLEQGFFDLVRVHA